MILQTLSLVAFAQTATAGNPVLAAADPHVIVVDGKAWMYPTKSPPGQPQFHAFSSTDLAHWKDEGPILKFSDVKWIDDNGEKTHYAWAPAVAREGRWFYLYYSVGPQGRTPSRIGVARGTSPAGPFADSGRPLLTGGNGFEAIDPMAFQDPKTGRRYLYAGGSAGAKLRVFELSADWMSLVREIPVTTPPKFTEGAFMHYRKGVYYLSYSHGGWRDSTYSGHYATSSTPVGPWTYRGAFLVGNDRHKGPGHHSFFQKPGTDEWYVAYHRWNDAEGNGPYRGARQVAIDRLYHEYGWWLRPVVMTDEAPSWRQPARVGVGAK
jgi:beta-xylosidase